MHNNKKFFSVLDMVYISLGAVLLMLGAWLTIPSVVPFTLQTAIIFVLLASMGAHKTLWVLLVYCLLGIMGVPVFASMRGGVGVLFGVTGGYILGFFLTAVCAWVQEKIFPSSKVMQTIFFIIGMIACYALGTVWFMYAYAKSADTQITLLAALNMCVIPFLIPDLAKLLVGQYVGNILKKVIFLQKKR